VPTFGVHERGGLEVGLASAICRGATALQLFQKAKQSYHFPRSFRKEHADFKESLEDSGMRLVIHASYFINLVSPKPNIRQLSLASTIEELDTADFLGADYLNIHPGSVGPRGDRGQGKLDLIEALKTILIGTSWNTELLLETMPGTKEWSQLGALLDDLADIVNAVKEAGGRIGVCFDTCHSFAAGYDFHSSKDAYNRFWDQYWGYFNEWPKAFHVNGAYNPHASRKDGHATLNGLFNSRLKPCEQVNVNPEFFHWLREDPRFEESIHILETPVPYHHVDLPAYIFGS
jgi:deoxyribonuclease-4